MEGIQDQVILFEQRSDILYRYLFSHLFWTEKWNHSKTKY